MYNATVHSHQHMNGTLVLVSVSETDEFHNTVKVFTTNAWCNDQPDGYEPYELEVFLEQMTTALVNALSTRNDRSS